MQASDRLSAHKTLLPLRRRSAYLEGGRLPGPYVCSLLAGPDSHRISSVSLFGPVRVKPPDRIVSLKLSFNIRFSEPGTGTHICRCQSINSSILRSKLISTIIIATKSSSPVRRTHYAICQVVHRTVFLYSLRRPLMLLI